MLITSHENTLAPPPVSERCGLGHFLNFLENFLWSPPLLTLGLPFVPPLHLIWIFLNMFFINRSWLFWWEKWFSTIFSTFRTFIILDNKLQNVYYFTLSDARLIFCVWREINLLCLTQDYFTLSDARLFYSVWHEIILLCLMRDYFTLSNTRLFYSV